MAAVVGGLALVGLVVVAALTTMPDRGAPSPRADGGRATQGPADGGGMPTSAALPDPSTTAPVDDVDAAASTPSRAAPAPHGPATSATSAATPTPSAGPGKRPKHHGKPPWSTSHPGPVGHGGGHH